jgi:hypothetical protein
MPPPCVYVELLEFPALLLLTTSPSRFTLSAVVLPFGLLM